MFKKLFKKGVTKEEVVFAPVTGDLVDISEVPDPTFSKKMMGDGIAIKPNNGEVVAPVNGEIVQLFPTKHAIGIKSEAGIEYLIHIGLETVGLNGEGFEAHVGQGDKVAVGDSLITVDLDLVSQKAEDTITPIIITNEVNSVETKSVKKVTKGQTEIMTVTK